MRPPSSARAKEAHGGERNEGARVNLALALHLRTAELCLGSGVVSDHARGRTIDDLGPVLADEGGRGLKFVYMTGENRITRAVGCTHRSRL